MLLAASKLLLKVGSHSCACLTTALLQAFSSLTEQSSSQLLLLHSWVRSAKFLPPTALFRSRVWPIVHPWSGLMFAEVRQARGVQHPLLQGWAMAGHRAGPVGPKAHGPMAQGAHEPMGSWARGPMGPLPLVYMPPSPATQEHPRRDTDVIICAS